MEEEAREVEIDKHLKKKIKKTIQKILKRSSLYQMTEIKVREQASSELDLDLSQDPYKVIVREAVENFIEEAITLVDNKIGKLQNLNTVDEEMTTPKKKKKKKEPTS